MATLLEYGLHDLIYSVIKNKKKKHFTFSRQIIETFDISPLQARVAIVEYATTVSLSVALDNYGSKTRLICAVNELKYDGEC